MKAEEIFDCIYTRPYAENDALLNDYVDEIRRRVSWRLFERQEDICFMVSERNPPMLKDGAVDIIEAECHKELNWLVDYIVNRMLISYRLSNIDLGEEGEDELRWNLGDEEYEDFEKAAREYIYRDYVKFLGTEKTNLYFEKIGRPEYIPAKEQ